MKSPASALGVRGGYAMVSGSSWFQRTWRHLDLLPPDLDLGTERCRLFCSAPRPLQSVYRAELWCVILALQCSRPVHMTGR